ncbi:MAG: glycosyltransferase family 117 protein [Gemmatimonadaceae bacterium]
MTAQRIERDYRPSYGAAAVTGLAVLLLYVITLSPSTAMWDTSEYIAAAKVLGLPHPPGNPLFVLIGHVFGMLPIAPAYAMRINILAALASAGAATMWFLITERVLVGWLADRWQRIAGGAVAALIGATAFTVWNQSVVNEKVYTVSLFGLAVISWLTVRWSDDPDGPVADRILVLVAYLLGLGYSNHMMGFLAGPAVAVAVLVRRPATILRWKLLLICAVALAAGITPFLFEPIRAAHFPAINEGEPTTRESFLYNFNRGQYGKPSVFDRQAPFAGQLGMWWLYFRWQWLRDMQETAPWLQQLLAALFFVLGMFGGYVHWKRDRRSFWYVATFMFTLTLLLIWYLNFRYGHSQCLAMPNTPDTQCEVRDRDYFFIVSFSMWGVWAALGLVFLWESVAALFGADKVTAAGETIDLPRRRSWLLATPVLALAFAPMIGNWHAASRAHQTDTRDFAHDLLDSVEPYGVLITVGDNDTFPLWYAQEVEGIRRDVLVANTSLLNTDWYTRQLMRRPIYDYDAARGPAIYRGRTWRKPTGPPLNLTMAEADSLPQQYPIGQPSRFQKGELIATIRPQILQRADLLVLRMISDAFPARSIYFSRTAASYPQEVFGLDQYLLQQGLARKLMPATPKESKDTLYLPGEGWIDAPRTVALWDGDFAAPRSIIRRGDWVDKASVGIPYLYIGLGALVAELESRNGDSSRASSALAVAQKIGKVTGLEGLFQSATPPPPAVPVEQNRRRVPIGDQGRARQP